MLRSVEANDLLIIYFSLSGNYNQKMNRNFLKNIAIVFLAAGVLSILYSAYLFTHQADIARNYQLATLLLGPEKALQLDSRTQSSDCQVQGSLPDPDCTPGAVFPDAPKNEICVSGYSGKVRNVSVSLKKKVFAQYGISYPVPFGSYEIDHLIPLSLGGSNDIANLWPKSAEPFPGFYEKNITGNYLHEEVCVGRVALSVAQEKMASNWFLIYQNLDPKIIGELKKKYRNWADRDVAP